MYDKKANILGRAIEDGVKSRALVYCNPQVEKRRFQDSDKESHRGSPTDSRRSYQLPIIHEDRDGWSLVCLGSQVSKARQRLPYQKSPRDGNRSHTGTSVLPSQPRLVRNPTWTSQLNTIPSFFSAYCHFDVCLPTTPPLLGLLNRRFDSSETNVISVL